MSSGHTPWERVSHYREALQHGHRYTPGEPLPAPYWHAKPGSHDDGELSGLFLGGIGAPVVGRDVDGSFARWHLQNGYHLRQAIDSAFFGLRWEEAGSSNSRRTGYFRLAAGATAGRTGDADAEGAASAADNTAVHRTVYSLFPVTHEYYRGADPTPGPADDGLPLEAVVEFWTPLFNEADGRSTASWPVWFATITVVNRSPRDLEIDTVAFWPNVLGWRAARATALDQPPRPWPGQTHAGNTAAAITTPAGPADPRSLVGALQQRHPERPVRHDMEGQVLVSTTGPSTDRTSVEACMKAGINAIDRPPERQGHTVPWAEDEFRQTGALPATGRTWTAHWDEALASAVHRGFTLAPGVSRSVTYTITADLPIVEFGEGRRWYRKYTSFFGVDGRNARHIATTAEDNHQRRREEIAEFHRRALEATTVPVAHSRAAMLNELSFVTAGGAVWVDRWAHELDQDTLPEPRLGPGEHAGLLEGFDIGYYYYNTTDLWTYAWYAVARWWPDFARVIFDDLLHTIPLQMPEERIYYRTEERAPLLIADKVPHDVGAVMEDPWHALNGYQMRDDSNLWKDHNPGFIVSYYLFRNIGTGNTAAHRDTPRAPLTPREWEILRGAGEFILARTPVESGLPVHDEFGDSTWDNLGIRGRGSYSGSVTLAALTVLATWGNDFGRKQFSAECLQRVQTGTREYGKRLWTGEYFRLCDEGRYTESLSADALIGFYLADLAGFPELSNAIGRERIASHLKAVVRYNHLQYHQGTVGPLLVAAPDRTQYHGDGGDELQVNEVLVGSAWITVAMLHHYRLHDEARQMSEALLATLSGRRRGGRGLQFRTPAALDGTGRFRAPLNMRPLSIWFLDREDAPELPRAHRPT